MDWCVKLDGRARAIALFGVVCQAIVIVVSRGDFGLDAPPRVLHLQESEEYKAIKSQVDKRSAERLLHVCRKLGAGYTKIGQYISTLNHILPPEWTDTLAALQDKAASVPFEQVAEVLEEELGKPWQEAFVHIEPTPIAAASLAQVHRATTKDGLSVALKVQYPDLQRKVTSDLWALQVFFSVVEILFPHFGYTWLLPDFKALSRAEVNFMQEAHNAERVASMFAGRPRVHVPHVLRQLTTQRMLTMEFIDGCKITDHAALARLGVNERALAHDIVAFFADQVYMHGFVHCDPHPGNLLVRKAPDGRSHQLVVLDHGMYRRLTPEFRAAYCRLWKAMLLRDRATGLQATRELGLGAEAYDALNLILTFRSADSSAGLGKAPSAADRDRLRKRYQGVTAADINRFMQALPRDLLFVLRNMNMVRGLNRELGSTTAERLRINGESAIAGLAITEALHGGAQNAAAPAAAVVRESTLVTDVTTPDASSVPAAETNTEEQQSDAKEKEETMWQRTLRVLRGEHAVPLTYMNSLASSALLNEPTDSELLARAGKQQLPLMRRLRIAWERAELRFNLWLFEVAFALFGMRQAATEQLAVAVDAAEGSAGDAQAPADDAVGMTADEVKREQRRRHHHQHMGNAG